MTPLRKIYLSVHALVWLDLPPGDPRREEPGWEQFPGRCELSYRAELEQKEMIYSLIRDPGEDEGIFMLPDPNFKANKELTRYAQEQFGPRCVVCRYGGTYSRADWDKIRDEMGELGDSFFEGIEVDRIQATKNRGLQERALTETDDTVPGMETGPELRNWALSKAWAFDLRRQLEERGYTFDPASVEFVVFGGDWSYCSATFPIHMARAFGLSRPMRRSFELINRSCSPMLLQASVVEDDISMPDHIRLYIVKTKDGRHAAQFFEGLHGIMDPPHVVVVDFPPASVTRVDLWGDPIERHVGIDARSGRVVMSVGCGGHTRYEGTLVRTENLSLEDFRSALLNGKVVQMEW